MKGMADGDGERKRGRTAASWLDGQKTITDDTRAAADR